MKPTVDFERLDVAFTLMRRAGLMARQGYSCCSNCAGFEAATLLTKRRDAGVPDRLGLCYYHRQDLEGARHHGGVLYLRHGPVTTQKHGVITTLPAAEVAALVLKCCAEAGLKTSWDGNLDACIEVLP